MGKLFKFDSHLHTAESSHCGFISGGDLVDLYYELGYNGIAITDHLHEGLISSFNCRNDWNACVDLFLTGYKRALRQGEKIGLSVILGAELRFNKPNSNDYLIYGIDEEFLRKNPYPFRLGPSEFFKRFADEVLIIQAHPFRDGNETVFVDCIHGIELFNPNRRHDNYDEKGMELSKNNPDLYLFSGSDVHRACDLACGWMLFKEPITNSKELHEAVKRNDYFLGHA